MVGHSGREILIKVADGADPERFVTLAGIRTSEFSLNAQSVEATAIDSPGGWQELIAGAGVKSARIRGRGVFKDAESDQKMRQLFLAGQLARWQLIVPGMGQLVGLFQVRELKWTAAYDGEAGFAVDLESAGQLHFEAAA